MNKIIQYINEVYKEMQKVSWPTRKELYGFTILTIIASAIISLLIFGADRLIGEILGLIYGSAG
ncbi:MAG: preprotein translocase subunit SecE [Rhodothermaceae bacterium]|nr:preprotein translocase subunit SecE [Rhodothermaceae bacterium]